MGNFIRRISGALFCFGVLFALTQCNDDKEANGISGKVTMSITDAPIDDENVSSVILTFERIEIQSQEDGWMVLEEFDEPVSIDLLAYQNGESYFLTEEVMPAGNYDEIRLVLDESQNGTYILYDDGNKQQLKVPSGSQSGYKVKGDFRIPIGGVVNLTIDWDLRKAIVKAGNSGQYILKPTTRLIVNEDAGMIRGHVKDSIGLDQVVVFAYEDDVFTDDEISSFENAVTSAKVNAEDDFTLAFLTSGIYDLYLIEYDAEGDFIRLVGDNQNVTLQPGEIEEVEVLLEE
jgi:hypothetical protein